MPGSLLTLGRTMHTFAFRSAFLTALALLTLTLCAGSAAAARSCTKPGHKTYFRDATNVILDFDVSKDYYEDDASRWSVCSTKYGRPVVVGESGMTPDGPVWSDIMAMNSRFTVVVYGSGGNADGGSDDGISLYDLKSGKSIWSTSPAPRSNNEEASVYKAVVSPAGAVGWTNSYYTDDGQMTEVNVRFPGERSRRLAVDPKINTNYLRWSTDGKQLIWTDAATQVAFRPESYREARAPKRGNCLRPGDRLLGLEDRQFTYVSRPFSGKGWSHGRALIACSRTFKHRVTIARSGVRGGRRYSFGTPKVSAGLAAVVLRSQGETGDARQSIATYDLSRARRLCLTDVGPGLKNPTVGAVEFARAATYWNVSGESTDAAGKPSRITRLRVCDRGKAKTLYSNAKIDPTFLDPSDGYGDPATVVVDAKRGP